MKQILQSLLKLWPISVICISYLFSEPLYARSQPVYKFSGTFNRTLSNTISSPDYSEQYKNYLVTDPFSYKGSFLNSSAPGTCRKPGKILLNGKLYSGRNLSNILQGLIPIQTKHPLIDGRGFANEKLPLVAVVYRQKTPDISLAGSGDITC